MCRRFGRAGSTMPRFSLRGSARASRPSRKRDENENSFPRFGVWRGAEWETRDLPREAAAARRGASPRLGRRQSRQSCIGHRRLLLTFERRSIEMKSGCRTRRTDGRPTRFDRGKRDFNAFSEWVRPGASTARRNRTRVRSRDRSDSEEGAMQISNRRERRRVQSARWRSRDEDEALLRQGRARSRSVARLARSASATAERS